MRLLTVLLLLTVVTHAEVSAPRGVDLTLLSEQRTIAPGQAFTVALKIHHHPQYHTYWQNPGEVGVPVKLAWQLPPGFSAAAIQWPYPEPVMMKIYPAFGYERDVMLLVTLTPPAQLTSPSVTLNATANWMACAETCHPGEQTLTLTLPVADQCAADPALAASFAAARAELPEPLPHWSARLESARDAKEIRLRLAPSSPEARDPGSVRLFSCDGQISSEPVPHIEKQGDGAFLIIAQRSEYSPSHAASLPCVITAERAFSAGGKTFATIAPAYPAK